jgi:hypothetical protein
MESSKRNPDPVSFFLANKTDCKLLRNGNIKNSFLMTIDNNLNYLIGNHSVIEINSKISLDLFEKYINRYFNNIETIVSCKKNKHNPQYFKFCVYFNVKDYNNIKSEIIELFTKIIN